MPKRCSRSKSPPMRTVSCRGKLVNRKTGRCVKKSSPLGKKMLQKSKLHKRSRSLKNRNRRSSSTRKTTCPLVARSPKRRRSRTSCRLNSSKSSLNSVYLCKKGPNSISLCGMRPKRTPIQIH